jgi:GNAT superfamily N-acetyltransferase
VQSRYEIRPMRRDEVDIAVEWAGREGWNPGVHDASAFYAADPAGFFVGLLDGEPVASISAVVYDDSFAFLGFYIVKPEYRGRGYGLQIWQRALEHAGGRNIGLDGVLDQQANYERSGFKLAYRNVRYGGQTEALRGDPDGIVDLASVGFHEVFAFDREHFQAPRFAFLDYWLRLPESSALGFQKDGALAGYGVIRRCLNGYKIGPLFAADEVMAEALFVSLIGRVEAGAPVFLDVPEVNPAAVQLALRHQMQPVFETVRMYTGTAPALPLDSIFGVTSFELG